MPFIVISPALTANQHRGRVPAAALTAVDAITDKADQRMRSSQAAVWKLPRISQSRRQILTQALHELARLHQVDTALLDTHTLSME